MPIGITSHKIRCFVWQCSDNFIKFRYCIVRSNHKNNSTMTKKFEALNVNKSYSETNK